MAFGRVGRKHIGNKAQLAGRLTQSLETGNLRRLPTDILEVFGSEALSTVGRRLGLLEQHILIPTVSQHFSFAADFVTSEAGPGTMAPSWFVAR